MKLVLAGRSDVALATPATRRLYRKLLRAGVEIAEWSRSVLHAKAAAVDGARLLVGSFNLDPFSLANLEALAEIYDPDVAADGERWIRARFEEALPVAPEIARASAFERLVVERLGPLVARAAHGLGRWTRRWPARTKKKSGTRSDPG